MEKVKEKQVLHKDKLAPRKSILLVDDEQDILDLLGEILNSEAYLLHTAKDGRRALQIIKSQKIDLLLVDIRLPGLSGIEILKEAKEINPDLEGIVMTGYASLDTAIEAVKYDAFDYIEKPFKNIEDVNKIVKRASEKQNLSLQNKELLKQLRERVFELEVLHEVSNATNFSLNWEELIKPITNSIHKVIECDVCGLLTLDEELQDLVIDKKDDNVSQGFVDEVKLNMIEKFKNLPGSHLNETEPVLKDLLKVGAQHTGQSLVYSSINTPLKVGKKVIGLLNVSSSRKDAFDEEDERFLKTIGNQLSNTIQRSRKVVATQKSKIEKLVESLTDGVIMVDQKGEVVVWNPRAIEILAEAQKSESIDLLALEELLRFRFDQLSEEMRKNGFQFFKKEVDLKDSIYQVIASPVKDEEAKLTGMVLTLRDITKEKKLDKIKSEFISIASHELRTPLTAIKNSINIVLSKLSGEINDKQERFLDIAMRNINRLYRLINDFLDLSKMESGKMVIKKELIDLKELITSVVFTFQAQADEKRIKLQVKVPEDLPKSLGDQDRITQVLDNFLNNAIKFTPPGGKISIEAKESEDQIESRECKFIKVAVEDTGIGIDSKNFDKIFDKFSQLDNNLDGKVVGTGLGLPISKQIVQLHGGRIWVESKLGEGSKFYFTLPIRIEEKV
jgi:PAS domain S-box-containing protein